MARECLVCNSAQLFMRHGLEAPWWWKPDEAVVQRVSPKCTSATDICTLLIIILNAEEARWVHI